VFDKSFELCRYDGICILVINNIRIKNKILCLHHIGITNKHILINIRQSVWFTIIFDYGPAEANIRQRHS